MTKPDKLDSFFSDYRGEWSSELFRQLFIVPPYFSKLEHHGPCFLIGGRGTGKTTALRSLRFDATAQRLLSDNIGTLQLPYYGIYIRINKNRVRGFQALNLGPGVCDRAFAHYFNLLCGLELCRLVEWLAGRGQKVRIDLGTVATSFCIPPPDDWKTFAGRLNAALVNLEIYVNNPSHVEPPLLSMAEAPLRQFAEALAASGPLQGQLLFCCIDEYENLLDNQQAILNTYVKLATPPLSYKVGVKRYGLRCRATIDSEDVLSTPDDYAEIDIGSEAFDQFAEQVVERRLQRAQAAGISVEDTLDAFLPELPLSIEAEWLGCERIADEILDVIQSKGDADLSEWAGKMPANELYFVKYWAEGEESDLVTLALDWKAHPDVWATRLGNYGYASLFWLSKGRKGARIRKHYAGSKTFISLASGNIRYIIELIDEAIRCASESSLAWPGFVGQREQTLAAQAVGKRRLDQLEGLSEHGSDIKRLVLALGKVFFEFARDPVGKTPERTSFILTGSSEAIDRIRSLLYEGVADLAFEVAPRTKATTQSEMRDDEFRLHPIYAPFFEYSHRRKRRVTFSADTLLEVLRSPAKAVADLINRPGTPVEDLPRQLAMFSTFYDRGGGPE